MLVIKKEIIQVYHNYILSDKILQRTKFCYQRNICKHKPCKAELFSDSFCTNPSNHNDWQALGQLGEEDILIQGHMQIRAKRTRKCIVACDLHVTGGRGLSAKTTGTLSLLFSVFPKQIQHN